MSDVAVTETPVATVSEADQAAAAVADPQNANDQWKQNVESVLKTLAGFIPFRHEGEFSRIILALDNMHKDIQDVLANAEPVPPSVGQPDPVLQALIVKNQDLESKMDKLLEALGSNPVVQAASNGETSSNDFPPGWTKDENGNWIQTPADGSSSN